MSGYDSRHTKPRGSATASTNEPGGNLYTVSSNKSNRKKILLAVVLLMVIAISTILTLAVFKGADKAPEIINNSNIVKDSLACDKLSSKQVESVLGTNVSRVGGIFPDKKEPYLLSVCNYQSESKPSRNVSMVIRGGKPKDLKKAFDADKKSLKGESLDLEIGKLNYYNAGSGQLVILSDDRLYILGISKPTDSSKVESKQGPTRTFVLHW